MEFIGCRTLISLQKSLKQAWNVAFRLRHFQGKGRDWMDHRDRKARPPEGNRSMALIERGKEINVPLLGSVMEEVG